MKKRNTREPLKPHEKGLMIVAAVMIVLIFALPSLIWAEDFAILNNRLNDTYNEVWLIYDISGTVQDTAYKYNVDRWDTTFADIAAGLHRATFYLLDSADLSDTIGYAVVYAYQSGLTLTSADYDSIAAGISDAGTGVDTIVLYAVDTSASTDSLVPYTRFTVLTSGGIKLIPRVEALSAGYATVYLDTGSYTVVASAPGYYFAGYALTVAGNDDSVAIAGYGSFLSNHAYVYGDLGTNFRYKTVTFTVPELANNSCDSSLYSGRTYRVRTDASGDFAIYLPYSSCWTQDTGDTVRYKFSVAGLTSQQAKEIMVPDTSTYKVYW